MAEGLLRHLGGERFEAFSAGTEATQVRPLAIKAMAELGIDLQRHRRRCQRYLREPFDEVIAVCDTAAETCPIFPGAAHRRHWSFPDPSKATGSEQAVGGVSTCARCNPRAEWEHEML